MFRFDLDWCPTSRAGNEKNMFLLIGSVEDITYIVNYLNLIMVVIMRVPPNENVALIWVTLQ